MPRVVEVQSLTEPEGRDVLRHRLVSIEGADDHRYRDKAKRIVLDKPVRFVPIAEGDGQFQLAMAESQGGSGPKRSTRKSMNTRLFAAQYLFGA